MTTLQEAARKALYALEASIDGDHPYYEDQLTAIESLRTALAQQGEQAKPVAYITDTHQGPMVWTPEMYGEACTYCDDGEFPVPLYTAAPAPQAQPMTDPCKTCSHFKEGNLPGVRIHDETCYECRSYWGNKWEAA